MGLSDAPRREQLENCGLWLPPDRNGSRLAAAPVQSRGRDGLELARRAQRGGDRVEGGTELAANQRHRGDDDDGDERGDEAVFNRGRAIAIAEQLGHEIAHESHASWVK